MDITAIVILVLVGAMVGAVASLTAFRKKLEADNSKLHDTLYMLDDIIYKVVLGIEQMGLRDPLLEKGSAKLAKAMKIVEDLLNVAGLKVSFDEDEVARELVETWIEGVVSLMDERKGKGI